MPIYEFECNNCNKTVEIFCKYKEAVNCPKCDSKELVQIISSGGFQLKGTDWPSRDIKEFGI